MKTPTEAQLNDPKWWDGSAPKTADFYYPPNESFLRTVNGVMFEHKPFRESPWKMVEPSSIDGRYLMSRPDRSEPGPEQDSFADRIRELGNQVHNLGCEVQNDEVLAEGCEQIREQLWHLADQACKGQRERQDRKALTETIRGAVRLGLNEQGISNTVWAAGWRKAGEE